MANHFDLYRHEANVNPLVAVDIYLGEDFEEIPPHTHPSGQLMLVLHGAVTCEVPGAMWLVPPDCAVWIPGGVEHRSRATSNARICFVLVKPPAAERLSSTCCTLAITPMIREIILHLTKCSKEPADEHLLRLMGVLMHELEQMPVRSFQLPLPPHPKLRAITEALIADPAGRTTLQQWSDQLAMSERTLARLILAQTGMTFGQWRQQLYLLVALRHLAAGDTVQQVSGTLGYASVTAFITMFRKAMGITPSRYFSTTSSNRPGAAAWPGPLTDAVTEGREAQLSR